MKKGYLVGILAVIVVVVVGCGVYFMNKPSTKTTTQNNQATTQTQENTSSNQNNKQNADTTSKTSSDSATPATSSNFTQAQQQDYYKLSQNVGAIGLPSASMTCNINAYKTINGINYYKTYNYNTRAAYKNDNTTPENGNYSHLVSSKVISLDGQTISESDFGTLDTSKLTPTQIENEVQKIASLYVEGYTANNPNLVTDSNNDYEGNLNAQPQMSVDIGDTKNVNGETLYNVIVDINNFKTPIFVGLDGYIYIANETLYNQLFFPNKINA